MSDLLEYLEMLEDRDIKVSLEFDPSVNLWSISMSGEDTSCSASSESLLDLLHFAQNTYPKTQWVTE